MSGIRRITADELRDRIGRFRQTYIDDWNTWLGTQSANRPKLLGVILRKWQACRPNRMRRTRSDNLHSAPFLEDLIDQAQPHVAVLQSFDTSSAESFTDEACHALRAMWSVFEQLSYQGKARSGLTGVVGISKAVMLLTDGRVGPAFDSQVRGRLGTGNIKGVEDWIRALRLVSNDIRGFEELRSMSLADAVPDYAHLQSGRIYDMALGPGDDSAE